MSATGSFVPPALIFPRKRQKQELIDGAPEDSLLLVLDSGYMNSDLFLLWLKHFITMVRSSKDTPVLLALENHSSHLGFAAIELACENGVVLLSLPPYMSHRMQSLDTGFFGPLKKAYAVACDNWQVLNPGRIITQFQVARLFGTAYSKLASVEQARKSFETCGIWPFNDQLFTDEDFDPADITDRPYLPAETIESQILSIHRISEPETSNVIQIPEAEPSETSVREAIETTQSETNRVLASEAQSSLLLMETSSTLSTSRFLNPSDIRPLAKATYQTKRKLRCKKSEILTSSPISKKKKRRQNKGINVRKQQIRKIRLLKVLYGV